MKKIIPIAICCAASLSAYALPVYEPFTEYASQVTSNPTNAIDLCSNGLAAPSGETWGSLNYAGHAGGTLTQTNGTDILVTNFTGSKFTSDTLSAILPANFPGMPAAGQAINIVCVNPAQRITGATIVGNSAVLNFNGDITRPVSGSKTLYISYLLNVAQLGQLGTGNDGRYLAFLASSNLFEPSAAYPTWTNLFNTYNTTTGPKYCGHGLLEMNASTAYIAPCDSSAGKDFTTSTFTIAFTNGVAFVVGSYTFNASGADVNSMWVNPSTGAFGGPTPPASPVVKQTMAFNMTDIGGLCLLDRPGNGQLGGVGTNYMANLIIGSTWSYVTGGPEFTTQPVSVSGSGSPVVLSAVAVAAGQGVSYQWQRVGPGNTTTNITTSAGGGATVSGATSPSLTLANMSAGDAGSYQVLATANGTSFSLASSVVTVTDDPLITAEPVNTTAPFGGNAVFSIAASSANLPLTFQWNLNGLNISPGTLGDGSTVTINSTATTSSLTIGNYQPDENPATVMCGVTNSLGAGELSTPASVVKADPAFTATPQSISTSYGQTATFTASFTTSFPGMTWAWYKGATPIANGPQPGGSSASGATGSTAGNTATATLTLTGVSEVDDGSYTLVANNNSSGTTTSAVATLFVNDPVINTQPPAVVEVAVGANTTVTVGGGGTSVNYSWNEVGGSLSGDFSGQATPTLTLTGAQSSDTGNYYLTLAGATNSIQSSTVAIEVESPVTAVSVGPPALTQLAGTHLALVGTVTGGSPYIHVQWSFNNGSGAVPLANGTQADGSIVSGGVTTATAPGISALVLSNLQTADSGTYTMTAFNQNGSVSSANSAVVTVTAAPTALSPANLVVTRVGEGSQPLSGATGNTLYLDQFTTSGGYVNSIMVPDSGPSALIVPGGAPGGNATNDSFNEAYLTLSSNGEYLNFAGYFQNYPYTGGNDVTFGGNANPRSIGAVSGLGACTLAYTNEGLFSGGAHFIRDAYSTDGLTNFWTTGAAGSGAVKFAQVGVASYANGTGIPAISDTVNGPICLGLAGTNLVFSDTSSPSGNYLTDTNGLLGISGGPPFPAAGLDIFAGAPQSDPAGGGATNVVYMGYPADFAFSADQNTLYVADADVTSGQSGNGGVQRYDLVGGVYTYAYNLYDTASPDGTNGLRGLTVYFPPGSTGQGSVGAVLYATTSEVVGNRIIQITDNGPSSASTTLATAGPNQFYRGIRFAPSTVALSIVGQPQPVSAVYGQSGSLAVNATGTGPITYQWQINTGSGFTNILNATNNSLALPFLTSANAGTYDVIVTGPIGSPITSSPVVVSVNSSPILLSVSTPQSLVETVGDHTAFAVSVAGAPPLSFSWKQNSTPLAGATNNFLILTNLTTGSNGSYVVTYSNTFSSGSVTFNLSVTAGLQPLSPANLVVSRVGDGAQALSSVTGNTVYLDQLTTAGAYVNTIMIPDNAASGNLIVPGSSTNAPFGSILNLSGNGDFLNFCGYDTPYPAATFNTPATYRSIGSVDAFGYFSLPQINQTIYNASGDMTFDSVVSADGFSAFWTTGLASSPPGLKYAPASAAGPAGGNVGIAGSPGGTRVVSIVHGNIVYSDSASTTKGLFAFNGEPTVPTGSNLVVADVAGSPNDFAASPDTTFPPASGTVYLGDNSAIASGGGIQRYDWNGSAYILSYTLGTGAGLTNGASGLTADFSASPTWGPGQMGAIIYATTAGASGNSLIKIVDNGAGSGATVLEQAGPGQVLRGVRFGPAQSPPIIPAIPAQNVFVGGTAVFAAAPQVGPITGYQWYLNGALLTNGPSPSGSGAIISGVQTASLTVSPVGPADDLGSYTIVVTNPYPSPATSAPVLLKVPVKITTFPPVLEYATIGGKAVLTVTATGGAPLTYQWAGPCANPLSDGPTTSCSGNAIAGSSTASLTISGLQAGDAGSYYVTVSNPDPSSATSSTVPTVLNVVTAPQFASLPITGLGASPVLNFSGTAGTAYRVWGSADVSLAPVTSTWTLLGSGSFSGGADTFAITPAAQFQYYVLTQP